ncbi:hypothetical protein [Halomonas sp. BM-2019]|uniref:hypothetical protein n=1 Tax=Halomonas sp. BM-2019 TaxID=2811227 RepID=UPI001B3C3A73|nr:MAG: hypothetical protein J5F18_14820 [Halomonas sp. BM-2019]
MSACLPISEGWDDRAHPVNDDGHQGRAELARACGELWQAAIRTYHADASASWRGKHVADADEAFEDLLGDRRLLARLLEPFGLDPDVVGDAMLDMLEAGDRWNGNSSRPEPPYAL